MLTPWGQSDGDVKIAPGVYETYTPSHGGIMVGARVARESLSAPALAIGEPFGRWLAFEEDCAYAAVYLDRPDWYRKGVELGELNPSPDVRLALDTLDPEYADEVIRADMRECAHYWFPDEYGVACRRCTQQRGPCYNHRPGGPAYTVRKVSA